MKDQEIQVGDAVRLRSGGPRMTVDEINTTSSSSAHCLWFHRSSDNEGWNETDQDMGWGECCDGVFALASLKKEDEQ